jgi:hypothetical protein
MVIQGRANKKGSEMEAKFSSVIEFVTVLGLSVASMALFIAGFSGAVKQPVYASPAAEIEHYQAVSSAATSQILYLPTIEVVGNRLTRENQFAAPPGGELHT